MPISPFASPLAGVITGVRMAAKSLEPSLMPRSAVDQGLIMAGSFATGYVVGSVGARTLGLLPVLGGSAITRFAGLMVTGARYSHLLEAGSDPQSPRALETSAWAEAGSDTLTSIALAKTTTAADHPVLGAFGGAAVVAATISDVQDAIGMRDDDVDATYLATAVGTAVGAVGAVAGLGAVVRFSGRYARGRTSGTGFTGAAAYSAGAAAAAGVLVLGVRAIVSRVLSDLAASNNAVEIAYEDSPTASTVSGGPDSLVPYDTLGLQGRRLVSEVTTGGIILEVMGEPARAEAVRVFIGVESAESPEDRIELAIAELHRTGGFDRSTILAASPAGTGYVNYITVEAAELMARGDIATVAIQYGSLPSMLSMNRVDDASRLYGALIARLRSEIDALGGGIRLLAYGESLGAQTSQNGIDGISGPEGLPVDAALWVGTPAGTDFFRQLTNDAGTPVFDRPAQLAEYVEEGNPLPEATLLNHDNDPVAKFTPSLFHEMPDWLASSQRGRGVSLHQRWLPGVAFWQGLIDTKNAATVVPGEFNSTGHDYRADLASFVRTGFSFADVTDEQMAAVEETLRASEIKRAENIAEGMIEVQID
ncbi:MAG: alpha/beta-hydrolase family protein [Actinomycetota bacterium]